jgi:hypothetical protein
MVRVGEQLPFTANLHGTLSFEVENFEKNTAPNRKIDFGTVLWDMSLWGTLKAIGADLFHIDRTQKTVRTIEVLKANCKSEIEGSDLAKEVAPKVVALVSQTETFFKEQTSAAQLGILTKAGYLASLAIAGLGYVDQSAFFRWTGISGALLLTGYFFFNAASSSGDDSKKEIALFKDKLSSIETSLNKEIVEKQNSSNETLPPPYVEIQAQQGTSHQALNKEALSAPSINEMPLIQEPVVKEAANG